MDSVPRQEDEGGARAVHQSLEDLAIHNLRVDIVGNSMHLRGLVSGYQKKCLAGARALTELPGIYISNELRVSQV